VSWQERIPEATIRSFRRQFGYICTMLPRMGGSVFSDAFEPYLIMPLTKGLRFPLSPAAKRRVTRARKSLEGKRERFDPLLLLFERWAAAEQEPNESVIIEDEIIALPAKGEKARLEIELQRSIKNITSLLVYKLTVGELVTLTCLGDDESLFRLVELDKVFLTAEFTRERILRAQWGEERQFFRSLSISVAVDSYRQNLYYRRNLHGVRVGIACYLLWFLGFRDLPRDELLDFLETHKLAKYEDPYSFYHMLNRIGLRKYRKVGSRKR